METTDLVEAIHSVRNTSAPSRIILPESKRDDTCEPVGVLLLKPSSGHFPPNTIQEILDRLVLRHAYLIRSVVWWNGADIRAHRLMSLHYPGFHRIAHGGWAALSETAKSRLDACYNSPTEQGAFEQVYGVPFRLGLVCTPYELTTKGISPQRLNQLWELDRSEEPAAIKKVQRLDDEALSLALELAGEVNVPAFRGRKPVVLLNGFYTKLEEDFEARGCVALWIQKDAASATSWDALRTEFAGKTNPFQAPPHTVREDAARGVLKVETVSILANVVHLSATEIEGRREVEQVWWEPGRFARVFGTDRISAGMGLS
jgi:hypothetical protein